MPSEGPFTELARLLDDTDLVLPVTPVSEGPEQIRMLWTRDLAKTPSQVSPTTLTIISDLYLETPCHFAIRKYSIRSSFPDQGAMTPKPSFASWYRELDFSS